MTRHATLTVFLLLANLFRLNGQRANAGADDANRPSTESIGKILDEVRTKVFPILDDTQQAIRLFLKVVQELQDPEGNMQQLFANLNTISGKISRGEGTVGRLLSEDILMKEIEALVSQLNGNLARFEPLFDDLKTTVGNVSKISAKFNKQSKDLPEITSESSRFLGMGRFNVLI